MNICLIGDGLTSLVLAKILVNKKINVSLYGKKNKGIKFKSRTIGLSTSNFEFFSNEIINLKKKNVWPIKQIEVYSEKYNNQKILNFKNSKRQLLSIIKNNEIYELLNNNLTKKKLFKKFFITGNDFYRKILKEKKYDLIINCDGGNRISKNFFYKKINKNYNSCAYTTIIKHKKISNFKAVQIFTKLGPIAFLPISNYETSIVFSIIKNKSILNEKEVKNLIYQYSNNYYKIKKFTKLEKFELKFSALRNYHYKNIMMFGDGIHRVHPLAGQGFNMTLRDIKILCKIIQDRIDLGLHLNETIFVEFENKMKHLNFIFGSSIDFIYEVFKLDNKLDNKCLNYLLKFANKNKFLHDLLSKYADRGLAI